MRMMSLPMPRALRRLVRDTRGIALIEGAFTVPLLALAGFTGLELANMAVVNLRISNIALSVADNASRIASGSNLALPQIRESDINDVFAGAQVQSGRLDIGANGRIILSSLQVNDAGNGQTVRWQRCYGALELASAYQKQGDGATTTSVTGMGPPSARITATDGIPVMFVEVEYTYQPIVLPLRTFGWTRKVSYEAAVDVRDQRDTTQVYNPDNAVVMSNCGTVRRVP